MLTKLRAALALLLTALMLVSLSACDSSDEDASPTPITGNIVSPTPSSSSGGSVPAWNEIGDASGYYDPSDTWALYWYMCGSDLETDNEFASGDIEELLAVDLPDNVTVVIEAGGALEWHNGFDADYLTRAVYDSTGFAVVEEVESASMGDPDTLLDFLDFCDENYPADHRIVVFWDHGGGSVSGVCFDEQYYSDSLTLPELNYAFSNAKYDGFYELIGFDACLMATIDTATAICDFARWMVASEETEPGCGWQYTGFFTALTEDTTMNGGELGTAIVDTYYEGCDEEASNEEATLSVINLEKIPALVEAYNAVGVEAIYLNALDPSYFNQFGRAVRKAEKYGSNSDESGYTNMIDIGDMCARAVEQELISQSTYDTLLEALNAAVYYMKAGDLRSNANGLSCYYSLDGDFDTFGEYMGLAAVEGYSYFLYYGMTGDLTEEIYDYLVTVGMDKEEVAPQEAARPNPVDLEDFAITVTDDAEAVLNLGSEIANQLVGVYFNLAYINSETGLAIFLGSDNDLIADWDTGVFKDNFRGVWGSIDGAYVYMELSDEADEYQIYEVPILLNGKKHTLIVSYVYATEQYNILGAKQGIDEHGMADKNLRPLIAGDVLEPLLYVMQDYNSDDDPELTALESITVTADTKFAEQELGDGEFIFMFEMLDATNNSYNSEAILITIENGDIYLFQ